MPNGSLDPNPGLEIKTREIHHNLGGDQYLRQEVEQEGEEAGEEIIGGDQRRGEKIASESPIFLIRKSRSPPSAGPVISVIVVIIPCFYANRIANTKLNKSIKRSVYQEKRKTEK
jgi:hypothetical protein